ncbi:MAG: uracil-DNA glycosylase family protein [Halobacteriales archaeon]
MYNVTDEVSNPFGMRPPCPCECTSDTDRRAVFGYGDANADFHIIGDHPGVHGGADRGIPFTGMAAGERVLDVLEATNFLYGRDRAEPKLVNAFCSYLYLCCVPDGDVPTDKQYVRFEPFFDAELRAIAAHVLLPVGKRATAHVLENYTARPVDDDGPAMETLHADLIHGSGFLVLPMADPSQWTDADRTAIIETIRDLKATDYQQEADLGRFGPGGTPYRVR